MATKKGGKLMNKTVKEPSVPNKKLEKLLVDYYKKLLNINCPNCKGKTGKKCIICYGAGKIEKKPLVNRKRA